MTSIIVTTADYLSGNLQQTSLTYVNPNADNSKLKTFAQMTAALSKDSYVKTTRVDKTELD